tara:strand:+ start:1887 stop:2984 length:1098 start_codon:yes stop_codon:yes gene_type:complete
MLISGPISFKLYYNSNKKHYIFIFGDEHESLEHICNNKSDSVLIWDFLNNLFIKNKDKFFNFYLETYQINDDCSVNIINNDSISNIISTFNAFTCIKDKIKIKYPNIFFHYIDFRLMSCFDFIRNKHHINYKDAYQLFNNIELLDYYFLYIFDCLNDNICNFTKIHLYLTKIKKIFIDYNLYNYNINSYVNLIIDKVNYSKIDKQFSKIYDNNIIDKINSYFYDYMNNIKKEFKCLSFKNVFRTINLLLDDFQNNKKNIKALFKFYYMNFLTQIILMDIYTLARIFKVKNFSQNVINNDISSNTYHIDTSIIYDIVYVGQKHMNNYISVFNKLDYDLVFTASTIKNNKRCIDIDNSLFSNLNINI